jgi:hypothetical protein
MYILKIFVNENDIKDVKYIYINGAFVKNVIGQNLNGIVVIVL